MAALLEKARPMLRGIPVDRMRELLAKSRLSCASHWQMAVVMTAGWDAANKLNLQVDQSVGQIEMHRLMKVLNLEKPKNMERFMAMMTLAMETFLSRDYFDYEFQPYDRDRYVGIIRSCYAYTKVRSLGVEKEYACGCFGLRQGWYQAMGVQVTEKVLKCLKDGDSRCEILIEKIVFPSA